MTTLNNTLLTQVINELKQLSESVLKIAHNDYCVEIGYEDIIYDNDEYNINEQFITAFDALRNIEHYNLSDNYFYTHNGNIVSFNYLDHEESPITFSELAQWIIDNDLFSDYDIEVITLDDMLVSIEDNITDASLLLYKLIDYLGNSVLKTSEFAIDETMSAISDYDYNQLNDIITHLGIDYE